MIKRKRDDTAVENSSAESKKFKRDKSKYSKNVDPNSTKDERKAARKLAKAERKAGKSQTEKDASKARAQANDAKSLPKHVVQQNKHAARVAGQATVDGVSSDDAHTSQVADISTLSVEANLSDDGGVAVAESGAGAESNEEAEEQANAKARRKAARKAEKLALKQATKLAQANGSSTFKGSSKVDNVEEEIDDTAEQASAAVEKKEKKKSKKDKVNGESMTVEKQAKKDSKKSLKKDKLDQDAMDTTEDFIQAKATDKSRAATNGSQPGSSSYVQHPDLVALPETEITQFLQSKQISVKDAGEELRPITSFDYLPSLDVAAASPFKGFTSPTPIQAAAWPYLLSRRDVVGVAETGSGKTLAFGVPCVYRLMSLSKEERKHIKACIVSPTRELALQIQEQLAKFSKSYGLKVTCVYGGVNKDIQRQELKGTHIVVATPGRLNDFLQEGSIDMSHADYLVLDEADRMLDKGFEDEVRKIASSTASKGRQTLMFTATWPQSVRDLAASFMKDPVRIIIGDSASGELRANARIVQEVEVMEPRAKQQRLFELLKQYQSGKNKSDRILVFCLYKKEATRIEDFIRYRGFNVAGIHGDLSQQKRMESLEAFKSGSVPLLVATDVAARGLDIPAVKVVINVTFPLTVDDYVHRIGRTGRAGQDGRAITFFTDEEKGLAGALINVLKAANQPVPDELLKYGTTVKKKAHDAYGAFYKDPTDMKKATKITFD